MRDADFNEMEYCTPAEIRKAAEEAKTGLVPAMSFDKYQRQYVLYQNWKKEKSIQKTSENILLAYFIEMAKVMTCSTLWTRYSMLKRMIDLNENIKIDNYSKLLSLLKSKKKDYQPKKAYVFRAEEIQKFLSEAPDIKYLAMKVVAIFGVSGACRGGEYTTVLTNDVEIHGEYIIVNIPKTKTRVSRSFHIRGEMAEVVKKYMKLRPPLTEKRFFIHYQNGKCSKQFIGKHMFEKMPKDIAQYLELKNSERYTGRSFRRISATLLVDAGADLLRLKRHGACKCSAVTKAYLNDFTVNKNQTSSIISDFNDLPSTSTLQKPSAKATSTLGSNTILHSILRSPPAKKTRTELTVPPPNPPNIEHLIDPSEWQDFFEWKLPQQPTINITNCNFYFQKEP